MPHRFFLCILLSAMLLHANELINPSLETDADGNLPGWESFNADNPLNDSQPGRRMRMAICPAGNRATRTIH